MPTDLQVVFARRCAEKAQSDAHTTLALVSVALALIMVLLLFTNDSFAQAVELIGEIEF